MAFTPINFAINSYKALSGLLSSERLINFFAELTPQGNFFKVALFGTPGLTVWKNFGINNSNPIYGMQRMNKNLFVVCGITVYMIDINGNTSVMGDLTTTPGRVMMTNNGFQVTILTSSGQSFYCTTASGSLQQITDPNYQLWDSVTTMDGFTIGTIQGSRQFQISALNDTSTYSALDFATVEANGDNIVAGKSNNLEVWFFKESITEVYYNSGNVTFPFERKNGVFIQKGCAAKASISIIDGSFYFLGNDRIFYRTNGYQLEQISTFPISKEIESYQEVANAFSFIYVQEGHKFYCTTFPDANVTWCYDIVTGLWHERSSTNPSTQQQEEWKANCFEFFAGKNLVGDKNTGIIYELDLNNYTENGVPIISTAISATQFDNYKRDSIGSLVLMMDTGVGISYGQGQEPQIMMKTSTDGGKTYSNELWQPLGRQGEYEKEVMWTRVGYGRTLIIQISISDPVKKAIVGAYLDVNKGNI